MDGIQFLFNHFGEFLAVLMRISGIFVVTPVLSAGIITGKIKAIMIFLISLITFPNLAASGVVPAPGSLPELVVIGAGEFFVGFTIGFLILMVVTLFQVSGQFYSIQMGFGIINVFDPLAEASIPIISQLKDLLVSGVFLYLNGHHFVLEAVFRSYEMVPVVYSIDMQPVKTAIVQTFERAFHHGFLIGLPLIGIVFLMTMSLGLLSRLVPQMNVMVMGFGLKVLVGEFTFIMLMPIFMHVAVGLFEETFRSVTPFLQAMGGG